ncbi:TPN1 [Candida margitis]|uniref:TPN1 n=1 Tax=Candida margitis TaxID=1775924 RepID=UPI0022260201|nr:TPN1 [Candida margitis]KAI5970846.1 TPN1 [Candida margitis]
MSKSNTVKTREMDYDIAKIQTDIPANDLTTTTSLSSSSVKSSHSRTTPKQNSIFYYLNLISTKLDSLGVETRGIERILPHERSANKTSQFISVLGLWCSACGGLTSMSSFFLGPLTYELGLRNTLIAGIIGQGLGCVLAAYCSMMGPRSGCRQIVSARFLFGWWFVKIVALVCIIGVLGWSVVNCVVGGQILASLSNDKVPLWAGIVIIAGVTLLVAVGGIKQLLRVETFLSIPVNLSFLLLYIVASQKFQYLTLDDAISDPATIKGNWLSYFSLCYSITATWGGIASDYYILFPEDTPDVQVFSVTFLGTFVPTTFVGVIGLLVGNVALTYKPWGDAYAKWGMGGLLNEAFKPWGGGGKFLLVVMFLSLISNNILNTYSAAFDIQMAGAWLARVPRWFWAIVVTAIYLVAALVGRDEFSTILGNFLPMIGYWISMYFILLLEENTIFRTDRFKHLYELEFAEEGSYDAPSLTYEFYNIDDGYNTNNGQTQKHHYNFKIWNDYHKLTHGWAAAASFLIGATGAAVGMAQTYWIGPVARRIGGEYGGDIAMWLCMGFSGLVYPVLRYIELKYCKRTFIRQNSTTAQSYIRPKPKLYSLLKTPTTKSLILSLICTSVMIDLLKIRRDLDSLQKSYTMKFALLGEIITKLTNGDLIDLNKELKLANAFTSGSKYASVNDVELDQELEEFLRLAELDGDVQESKEQGGTYL